LALYAVQPYFFNPNNSRAAPMPRPKSELTSVAKQVGVRLIPAHYEEWKKLGGPKWLRQQLSKSIQEKKRV
jgi:predicted adenine nucleotide alpha hydrolase (AANH) superfamily ATPase